MKQLTLREARERKEMTQEQLAAKSGIDQTTISSLETFRHTNPTIDTRDRLADALGIAPSRLRFSEPEPAASVKTGRDRAGHKRSRRAGAAA